MLCFWTDQDTLLTFIIVVYALHLWLLVIEAGLGTRELFLTVAVEVVVGEEKRGASPTRRLFLRPVIIITANNNPDCKGLTLFLQLFLPSLRRSLSQLVDET